MGALFGKAVQPMYVTSVNPEADNRKVEPIYVRSMREPEPEWIPPVEGIPQRPKGMLSQSKYDWANEYVGDSFWGNINNPKKASKSKASRSKASRSKASRSKASKSSPSLVIRLSSK